jgi:hypothetical protein
MTNSAGGPRVPRGTTLDHGLWRLVFDPPVDDWMQSLPTPNPPLDNWLHCCCAQRPGDRDAEISYTNPFSEDTALFSVAGKAPTHPGRTSPLPPDPPSPASNGPSPRTSKELSAAVKKEQQEKLQAAVRDFVRRANGGMPLRFLDASTGRVGSGTIVTEKGLRTVTITHDPPNGYVVAFDLGRALLLKMPQSAIRKSRAVQARGDDAAATMVHIKVSEQKAAEDIICIFDTKADADNFHSCLCVLQMYAKSNPGGAAQAKTAN